MRSPPGLEPKAVISLPRPREPVREGTGAAGSHAESNADALRVARCKPCMAVGALRADITSSPFGNGGAPRSERGGLSSSAPKAVLITRLPQLASAEYKLGTSVCLQRD